MANDKRRAEIEKAAFELLTEKGFRATSMLEIAKRAHASNQTLYKWYGNKTGLFLSMIEGDTTRAKSVVQNALTGRLSLLATLDALGPALLSITLSDRAIALQRAAATSAHETDILGKAIENSSRGDIAKLLGTIIERNYPHRDGLAGAALYLDILIGETQVRRISGADPAPTAYTIKARSERASAVLLHWLDAI